jgi:hypothetical protein
MNNGIYMCTCAVHCVFSPYHEIACCKAQYCDCPCHVPLICDGCGATNWNLASLNKPHDQKANDVKGHEACAGRWSLPDRAGDRRPTAVVIPFPKRTEAS